MASGTDLEKLTPAPWKARPLEHDDWGTLRGPDDKPVANFATSSKTSDWINENRSGDASTWSAGPPEVAANLAFAELARNWLDVQVRRGWGMTSDDTVRGWCIRSEVAFNKPQFVYRHDNQMPLTGSTPLEAMQAAVDYDAELTKLESPDAGRHGACPPDGKRQREQA